MFEPTMFGARQRNDVVRRQGQVKDQRARMEVEPYNECAQRGTIRVQCSRCICSTVNVRCQRRDLVGCRQEL